MTVHIRALLGAALIALIPMTSLAQSPVPAATPTPEPPPAQSQPTASPTVPDAAVEKGAERRRPMAACRQDVEVFCAGKVKGDRRRCLDENAAKLSPACTAAREKMTSLAKDMRKSCRSDVKSLCVDATKKDGGEGVLACLNANTAKLSPDCGKAVEARLKAR